jgi:DNA-binding protein HU-alpha
MQRAAITQPDLAAIVAQRTGMTKIAAKRAIAATLDGIAAGLQSGRPVKLAGFGVFSVRTIAARDYRNPQTGETATKPAMRTVRFKGSVTARDTLNAQ